MSDVKTSGADVSPLPSDALAPASAPVAFSPSPLTVEVISGAPAIAVSSTYFLLAKSPSAVGAVDVAVTFPTTVKLLGKSESPLIIFVSLCNIGKSVILTSAPYL